MNFIRKFRFTLATLTLLALVISLVFSGFLSVQGAIGILALFQLILFCLERPQAALFAPVLTPAQISEFESILEGIKGYDSIFKQLAELHAGDSGGIKGRLLALEKANDELSSKVRGLRKSAAWAGGITTIGNKDFVSDAAAEALFADSILQISRTPDALESLIKDASTRERVLSKARSIAGLSHTKAALDGTTTPLPTIYVPQVIELVWKYGQARQYATVYPLGAGTVKLPRLKAGEDDFGYLGAGAAGMSQAVPEKRVTAELITFTANKAGGIIRIPSEIEEDTFIPLGQFLARYIARQFAKLEDKTFFLADGSPTYANQTGIGPYCAANAAYLTQLGAGKTSPSDATLADFRSIRAKVNAAALVDDPAYYMHPSMEALLVSFNTLGQPLVYRPGFGSQPPTLDGFPIRWVGILQPYTPGVAAASSFLAMFGALNFWYLGERGTPRIEMSREVFFASDEIAMRGLERIDVEAMAIDAMSALQTAAA